MRRSVRGLVMTVVAILGILLNVIDGVDEDFSVWNGAAIVCFLIFLAYGISYLRTESSRR